jgi:DNA polymerase III delta prime subunit
MSLLSQVKRGKVKVPHLVLIYGPDGVGKSTFAADAPNPIFLGTEKGTSNLNVARFPSPKSFTDVLAAVTELTTDKHEYQTLVIDSLDWLEPVVWEAVIKQDGRATSIEDVGGGYGKGYVLALRMWQQLKTALEILREKRDMNIVLIAHSQVKTFQDPTLNAGYDRYQLKLNDKAAALFREFVDTVLFANYEVLTHKDGSKTRAVGDGARFLFTERRPAFDAKNRWGLPFKLDLDWAPYAQGVDAGHAEDSALLKARILELAKEAEPAIQAKVESYLKDAGDDPAKLAKLENKLMAALAA